MRDRNLGVALGIAFIATGVGFVLFDYLILKSDASNLLLLPWIPFSGTLLIIAGLGFLYVNISKKYDPEP